MLADKPTFSVELGKYVQKHACVTIKHRYLDLSRWQSANASKMKPYLTLTGDGVTSSISNSVQRPNSPRPIQATASNLNVTTEKPVQTPTLQIQPISKPTRDEIRAASKARGAAERNDLVVGVCKLLQRSDSRAQEVIVSEVIKLAPTFKPPKHTGRRLPFSVLVDSAQEPPPDPALGWSLIDLSDGHLFWEVDWLLKNLSRYADLTEFPEIMRDALTKAAPAEVREVELVMR
jgi:hypothetical protein